MTDLGLLENAASLVGIPQQSERTDLGQKKAAPKVRELSER